MTKKALPATWLLAQTLQIVWKSRVLKKQTTVSTKWAQLEAGIMVMRKTRLKKHDTVAACVPGINRTLNLDFILIL